MSLGRMDSLGIGLFLTSLPHQAESEFYENELSTPMSAYRQLVEDHFDKGSPRPGDAERAEFSELLYRPRAYYLFGRFDLAVLTLLDDHELSSRVIRPFSHLAKGGHRTYSENFTHKAIPGPSFMTRSGGELAAAARRTFLDTDHWPLLGVTFLKLNNNLLVGKGLALVAAVTEFIYRVAKRYRPTVEVVLLQSYEWHELTLLVFAESYGDVLDLVLDIRESNYRDLRKRLRADHVTRWSRYLDTRDLLQEFQTNLEGLDGAHLFTNSETVLGFDFRLKQDPMHRIGRRLQTGDSIQLVSRWSVRPGHLRVAHRLLEPGSDRTVALSAGRGDFWFPPLSTRHASKSTRAALLAYVKQSNLLPLKPHLLQRFTTITIPRVASSLPGQVLRRHHYFTRRLHALRFSVERLAALRTSLREIGVPKSLTMKVLNMFANFNDGILDRTTFASFFELRPFLEDVERQLVNRIGAGPAWSTGVEALQDRIGSWTDNFERAYRNRLQNSERLGEITDYNLEFKGGIQQILSAVDAGYKAIGEVLGNPRAFVHVGSAPGIHSTESDLRLNYFHVFQPESFLAFVGHEAGNWHLRGRRRWHEQALCCIAAKDNPPIVRAWATRWVTKGIAEATRDRDLKRVLTGCVSDRFLQAWFADLLSLRLCYNDDVGLWTYWSLGTYLQMPIAYTTRRSGEAYQLESAQLFAFLLRLALAADGERQDVRRWVAEFGDPEVTSVFADFAPELFRAVESLRTHGRIARWLYLARCAVDDLTLSVYAPIRVTARGRSKQLGRIQAHVAARASAVQRALDGGEIPTFRGSSAFDRFAHCQSLLLGYLGLLRALPGGRPRLIRTGEGEAKIPEGAAALLFDPAGGVFTHDPESRRRLFRYRSAVTLALWDLGLRTKKHDIEAVPGELAPVGDVACKSG